jgi:hypothetical protein
MAALPERLRSNAKAFHLEEGASAANAAVCFA